MKAIGLFKKALDDVRAQASATQNEIERLKARRAALKSLPLPKADFIQAVLADIDRKAEAWGHDSLQIMLEQFAGTAKTEIPFPVVESNGTLANPNHVHPGAIYGLLRDEIKTALRTRIEAAPWPEIVGPTRAARSAELARLNVELDGLEADLKQLHADARAAGFDLTSIQAPTS